MTEPHGEKPSKQQINETTLLDVLDGALFFIDSLEFGDAGERVSDQYTLDDETKNNIDKVYGVITTSKNFKFLKKVIELVKKITLHWNAITEQQIDQDSIEIFNEIARQAVERQKHLLAEEADRIRKRKNRHYSSEE